MMATANATARRRTQEERSSDTQERILRAALTCIETKGLQNASTHDIARSADVSRGAMLHHFPTRSILLEAAFSLLLEEEAALIERFSQKLTRDGSSLKSLIDFIWERYSGPLFGVTMDYLALARVDDETMKAVVPGASRYIETLDAIWDKCLENAAVGPAEKRALMNQTMFIVRGMAFQRVWRDDPAYFEHTLEAWVRQLQDQLGQSSSIWKIVTRAKSRTTYRWSGIKKRKLGSIWM